MGQTEPYRGEVAAHVVWAMLLLGAGVERDAQRVDVVQELSQGLLQAVMVVVGKADVQPVLLVLLQSGRSLLSLLPLILHLSYPSRVFFVSKCLLTFATD